MHAGTKPETLEASADDGIGNRLSQSRPQFGATAHGRIPAQSRDNASGATEKYGDSSNEKDREAKRVYASRSTSNRTKA